MKVPLAAIAVPLALTLAVAAHDFDADDVPDFLGGADDGRFDYLRNHR